LLSNSVPLPLGRNPPTIVAVRAKALARQSMTPVRISLLTLLSATHTSSVVEAHSANALLEAVLPHDLLCHCSTGANDTSPRCLVPALGRPLRVCFDHDPGQKNRWNELQGFSHAVSGLVSVSSLAPNPSHACALLSRSNPTLVATQSECVQRVPNNYIEYSKARCFNDLQKLADQGMQPDVVLSSWDDKTLLQRYLERFRVSPHLAHRVWVISARRRVAPRISSPTCARLASLSRRYSLRDRRLYRVPQVNNRYHYAVLCDTMLQGRVFSKEAREAVQSAPRAASCGVTLSHGLVLSATRAASLPHPSGHDK
jgi:hypothetical protein